MESSNIDGTEQRRCAPNVAYLKTLLGIIKIAQAVLSILTFILSLSAAWGGSAEGWVNFVAINGFIQATIWLFLHLFNAVPQIFANFLIEVIIYSLWTLFFFIAGIVAAVSASRLESGVAGAAAFFSFVCMVLFGVDAVIQLLAVRNNYKARNDRRGDSEAARAPNNEDTLFSRSDKQFY